MTIIFLCAVLLITGFITHRLYLKNISRWRMSKVEQDSAVIGYHWAQVELDYLYADCTTDEFNRWNPHLTTIERKSH